MNGVETALIILVIIWSLIFIIFGVGMFIILMGVKKGIDRINDILDDAHKLTSGVSGPLKAAGALLEVFSKAKKKLPK